MLPDNINLKRWLEEVSCNELIIPLHLVIVPPHNIFIHTQTRLNAVH